jgi:hypothetical protein
VRYHCGVSQDEITTRPDEAAVGGVLKSLKSRIDAAVVGILDGTSGRLYASSAPSASAFWKTVDGMACMPDDWGEWDLQLLGGTYARMDCECGAHRAEAFTIHGRWILFALLSGPLVRDGDNMIQAAIEKLQHLLPDSESGGAAAAGRSGGGGSGPAELGMPVWVRRIKPN